MIRMHYDQKMLADAPTESAHKKVAAGAFVAVALLFALGLAAQINGWILTCITALAASGFAVMAWPPGRDEREATTWWNGLTNPEREKWLTQGGTGMRLDAWEAYKRAKSEG